MAVRRCYVTVLFVDLCASTKLGDVLDPELYADLLRQVRELVEATVIDCSGVVNQFYGDGVLAIFGLPEPLEDDVTRAINAALALHELVEKISVPRVKGMPEKLQFHTGLDSGLVVVEEGDFIQGRYKIIGDSLNTAARLSDVAAPGEIIVSEKTISGVLPYFSTQRIQPLFLKGKSEALQAHRIYSQSNVSCRFEASEVRGFTHFIGRGRELAELSRLFAEVEASHGRSVCIVGEAGVGKSRLVDVFIQQERSNMSDIHRVYCREEDDAGPIQPLVQLLQSVAGVNEVADYKQIKNGLKRRFDELSDEQIALLLSFMRGAANGGAPGTVKGHEDIGRELKQIADVIVLVVGLITAHKPMVIFFDDWQNADERSRYILNYVLIKTTHQKIMVISTTRAVSGEHERRFSNQITVGTFSFQESKQVVHSLIDESELGLAVRIYEQSGGNALFIEELCRSAMASELDLRVLKDSLKIPTSLHGLIAARMSRLSDEGQAIARAAAVIGHVYDIPLLEFVLEHGVAEHQIQALVDAGIFFSSDSHRAIHFKHGVIRDTLYSAIGLKEKKMLHQRAVGALLVHNDSEPVEANYERLAYHYSQCGDTIKTIEFAIKAGKKALEVAALDRARYQLFNALAAMRDLGQTREVMIQYVDVTRRYALACSYYPNKKDLAILEYALICAHFIEDNTAIEQSEYWLGWVNYTLGNADKALIHFQRSYAVVSASGNGISSSFRLLTLGQALSASSDNKKAIEYFTKGFKGVNPGEIDIYGEFELSYALACSGMVLADMGDFEEAENKLVASMELITGKGFAIESSVCAFYSASLLWRGEWYDAMLFGQRARFRAEQVNSPYAFTLGKAMEAYASWRLSATPSAIAALEQSLQWFEGKQIYLHLSMVYGWLSEVMTEIGELAKAARYANSGVQCAARGDVIGSSMCLRVLAELSVGGEVEGLESAEHYIAKAKANVKHRDSKHEMAVVNLQEARIAMLENDLVTAKILVKKALLEFNKMGMHWHFQQAERLLSDLKVNTTEPA